MEQDEKEFQRKAEKERTQIQAVTDEREQKNVAERIYAKRIEKERAEERFLKLFADSNREITERREVLNEVIESGRIGEVQVSPDDLLDLQLRELKSIEVLERSYNAQMNEVKAEIRRYTQELENFERQFQSLVREEKAVTLVSELKEKIEALDELILSEYGIGAKRREERDQTHDLDMEILALSKQLRSQKVREQEKEKGLER